jgi:hypothetical protein
MASSSMCCFIIFETLVPEADRPIRQNRAGESGDGDRAEGLAAWKKRGCGWGMDDRGGGGLLGPDGGRGSESGRMAAACWTDRAGEAPRDGQQRGTRLRSGMDWDLGERWRAGQTGRATG